MKQSVPITTFIILMSLCACAQKTVNARNGLTGNNIIQFVQDKDDKQFFTDPVDDTTNYKKVVDNIYKDVKGKTYILTVCFRPTGSDTSVYVEYYKDVSDFLDVKTYGKIKNGFFQNKGKVYIWGSNTDGDYPIEVTGAAPNSFVPFDNVGGGIDKQAVFYTGVPGNFEIIKGADPKTIKVFNPESGCWNCGNCYFVDSKSVYFGLQKMEGVDPKTFKLLNQEKVDAEDKNGTYFEGKRIE